MSREQAIAKRAEELLTVKEFATVMRMDPLTVYRLIWAGKLRGVYQAGAQIRIDITASQGVEARPRRRRRTH